MIPILAWRNIWRNPYRSLVVIVAIAMGIWAAMFMTGFATGMSRSYVNNNIKDRISHIQIHTPAYKEDPDILAMIPQAGVVAEKARVVDHVLGVSKRTLVSGMVASGKTSRGILIKGIDPAAEASVVRIKENVKEGVYFTEKKKNQILIGEKLAEELGVKLRSKVILTFQDLNRDITAGAFRVMGIFETGSDPYDKGNVFVRAEDINRLLVPQDSAFLAAMPTLQTEDIAHEIALLLDDPQYMDTVQATLVAANPSLTTENYRELSPDLQLYESQIQNISIIYLTIIMLALIFGIVNTMLMAVLERMKELGMLMAIGMNKLRVFLMIVLETILLTLIGGPLGLGLGYLTTQYLSKNGLDLSAFSESMRMYGLSEQVYFDLDPVVYWQVPMAIILTAIFAAIYPAWRAIRLRPVEAIRKI